MDYTKHVSSPRGIYHTTRTTHNNTTTITHSISYPIYRGFTISADSIEALFKLVDWFWCPSNAAGITSMSQLNTSITNSLEDTCPIIHIGDIDKAS